MQTDRKKIGIILIIIGLVIIGFIVYFGFIKETEEEPVPVIPAVETPDAVLPVGPISGTTTPSDRPVTEARYDISQEAPRPIGAADLAKRAMLYSERLGSYSSQSDYGNFTDLKIYMTAAMRDWVDREIAALRAKNQDNSYYGIETRALTSEINEFDEAGGTAEITVVTERRESTQAIGGGEPFRQSIVLQFEKSGADWVIDGAFWAQE